MSPYGLRQSPTPSMRVLEAGEQHTLARTAKKKRGNTIQPKRLQYDAEEAVKKDAETQTETSSAEKVSEKKVQSKRRQANNEPRMTAKPSKRKRSTPRKQKQVKLEVEDDGSEIKTSVSKPSHKDAIEGPKGRLATQSPSPFKKRLRPRKSNKVTTAITAARPADTRGAPPLFNGNSLEVSPTTPPSPETPHILHIIDPDSHPEKQYNQDLQKGQSPDRKVPSYTPFDIVSGDKPPTLTTTAKTFWSDQVETRWQQEDLPDQRGRFWRCVKIVDNDNFEEDVGWNRGVGEKMQEARRKSGENLSPTAYPGVESMTEGEYKDFERDVDCFLRAFGDEGGWRGSEGVEGLDFGDGAV